MMVFLNQSGFKPKKKVVTKDFCLVLLEQWYYRQIIDPVVNADVSFERLQLCRFSELALDLGSGHLGKTLRSEKSLEPTVQIFFLKKEAYCCCCSYCCPVGGPHRWKWALFTDSRAGPSRDQVAHAWGLHPGGTASTDPELHHGNNRWLLKLRAVRRAGGTKVVWLTIRGNVRYVTCNSVAKMAGYW